MEQRQRPAPTRQPSLPTLGFATLSPAYGGVSPAYGERSEGASRD